MSFNPKHLGCYFVLLVLAACFFYILANMGILLYYMFQNPSLAFTPDININLDPIKQEFEEVKQQITGVNDHLHEGIDGFNHALNAKVARLEDALYS